MDIIACIMNEHVVGFDVCQKITVKVPAKIQNIPLRGSDLHQPPKIVLQEFGSDNKNQNPNQIPGQPARAESHNDPKSVPQENSAYQQFRTALRNITEYRAQAVDTCKKGPEQYQKRTSQQNAKPKGSQVDEKDESPGSEQNESEEIILEPQDQGTIGNLENSPRQPIHSPHKDDLTQRPSQIVLSSDSEPADFEQDHTGRPNYTLGHVYTQNIYSDTGQIS